MFEDHTGRIWLGIDDTVVTYKFDRFSEIKDSSGNPLRHIGAADSFAEDVDGNIWAVVSVGAPGQRRLLRIKDQRLEEVIEVDKFMPLLPFSRT